MQADKEVLREKLLGILRADLASLIRTQNDAQQGATHSENKAEHSKDTRATEQGYLARGLAERVEGLREAEARLARLPLRAFPADGTVTSGAIVTIRESEGESLEHWWLLPVAGGLSLEHEGETIRTITPGTPLGRALLGLAIDEWESLETPRGQRAFCVTDIA